MRNVSKRTALALAASFALTACGGSGLGAVGSGAGQTNPLARSGDGAGTRNFSGQYAGKFEDRPNPGQKGTITASFAQYQTSVGGSTIQTEGSQSTTSSVSFTVTNGTTFTGTGAATFGTSICVYDIGGTYNVTTHTLKGSYRAVSGCSADHGTFQMKQQCYYARKGAQADVGGLKMC
jgi:hypothetical protein